MKKKALITGVNGQDGSYLAEFLLEKNYEVHGIRRRSSHDNLGNLSHLKITPGERRNLFLHYGDLTESSNLNAIIQKVKPDEVYNLAAQSHVHTSFRVPEYTANVNALGVLRLLEAIFNFNKKCKFYQASTSEIFGNSKKKYQNEKTPLNPCSPYGMSKQYGFQIVKNYRERGFFACNGILFNHESPRRSTNFVTRKIVEAALRIKFKQIDKLYLGNIYAKRDWGYAKEFVEAMWKILQQKKPDDFVIATGKNYTVKYFAEEVFKKLDFNLKWRKKNNQVEAYDYKTKKVLIKIDKFYFRPTELDSLRGDYSKAKKVFNWSPKTNIKDLITIMIKAEMEKIL